MIKKLKAVCPFLIAIGVALAFSTCITTLFHPYLVSGGSMLPTYRSGSILRCTKDVSFQRGSVVIFYDPDHKTLIKRIAGLPGDELGVTDGVLMINGEPEDGAFGKISDAGILNESIIIPDNHVFLLGDNRNNSRDSRVFGTVDMRDVILEVEGTIWR